jgi:hypothetical protein
MRSCRSCGKKYKINKKHAGCCSTNCYLIRRKGKKSKDIFYEQKSLDLKQFMAEQLKRALTK